MSFTDFALTLQRLGFDRPGQVWWLTTTPEVADREVRVPVAA